MKSNSIPVGRDVLVCAKYHDRINGLISFIRFNWIITILLSVFHFIICVNLLDSTCERSLSFFNAYYAGSYIVFSALISLASSLDTPLSVILLIYDRPKYNIFKGQNFTDTIVILGIYTSIIFSLVLSTYGFYVILLSVKCKANSFIYYIASVVINCFDIFYFTIVVWLLIRNKYLTVSLLWKLSYNDIKMRIIPYNTSNLK